MKSKTKVKIIVFAIVYFIGLSIALSCQFGVNAKAFNKTFYGVEYNNSNEIIAYKEMTFEGLFSNPLFGQSEFQGEITYDGYVYQDAFKTKSTNWIGKFDTNHMLGFIYTDEQMNTITVHIVDEDGNWSGETGLIFSGNAMTIEEAKALTTINWNKYVEAVKKF